MAIWIVKNSGKTSYSIKRYLCDTEEDLPYNENGEAVAPGSKAYVIADKATFMMGSNGEWYQIQEGSGSGGASSMSELTDVDLTGLDDGKILKYDETEGVWKPANDLSATSIGNLEDVDLTGLEDGQMLKYDEVTQTWIVSDAPVDIVELTQEQYDELPSATKDLPLIYQISDRGYFFYKGKKFRASKEVTQAEYNQLTPEEQNDGTEYFITDAPETVAELTQAQYDVLTPDEKNNGTIWQISNKGYFYYKGKQFRASRELTQAEFDALPTSKKNDGTEYIITDATTSISDFDDVSISGATDGQSLYYDATLGVWKNSAGKIVYAEIDGTLTAGQDTIVLSSNYITTDSVVDPFVGSAFDGVTYTSMTIANGSVTLVFPVQATDMPVMVRVWIDGYGAANNNVIANYVKTIVVDDNDDRNLSIIDGNDDIINTINGTVTTTPAGTLSGTLPSATYDASTYTLTFDPGTLPTFTGTAATNDINFSEV